MNSSTFLAKELAERLGDPSVWNAYMEKCIHLNVCTLIGIVTLFIIAGTCVLYGIKKIDC